MLHRETQNWIVFTLSGRELARIDAALAALDEPVDTCALLARENACRFDDITVSIEEGSA
jgi:hypothetical protein